MLTLGIDPGWSSCGWAVNDSEKGIISSGNFVPKEKGMVNAVHNLSPSVVGVLETVFIERFVAYRGVQTSSSEDILMFIGALQFYFLSLGLKVELTRAIDWKPKLCKWLVKNKGFSNPFPSFDKNFSLLAAKTLSGADSLTDHEADAICLSYLHDK